MSNEKWNPSPFMIATVTGGRNVMGWVYNGLGLYHCVHHVQDKRNEWSVTHLRSGLLIALLTTELYDDRPAWHIATEIAELCDWNFGNRCAGAGLKEKVEAIKESHPKHVLPNPAAPAQMAAQEKDMIVDEVSQLNTRAFERSRA